jgi:hypothetical protein
MNQVQTNKELIVYSNLQEIVDNLIMIYCNSNIIMKWPFKMYDNTYTLEYVIDSIEKTIEEKGVEI